MRASLFSLFVLVGLAGVFLVGCAESERDESTVLTNSPESEASNAADTEESTQPEVLTPPEESIAEKLAKIGVKAEKKSDDELLITEGFPFAKDINGRDVITIVKVENGIFTPTKDSVVPIEMMGMAYGTAGASFVAQCTVKGGTRTLADCSGNTWIFQNSGTEFGVFLPGSTDPAYTVRSKLPGATISFSSEGVLLKGFEVEIAENADQTGRVQ